MDIPDDCDVSVIVVENDQENHSEHIVREIAGESELKFKYFLETEQGLVYARNRSVREAGDCDFCCFTDDDELVSRSWLTELMRCQREFNADGVAGPTYPRFTRPLPSYIAGFHKPDMADYGAVIESAYTGCLLLRKAYLDKLEGPFDVRLNLTGGEDINLTYYISKLGGVIRFNPYAEAFETFQASRETVRYILQRTYRNSNTGLYARYLRNPGNFKLKSLPRLIMRFFNGLILTIPMLLFGKDRRLAGLIKVVNAIGGFNFVLGRNNKFYK